MVGTLKLLILGLAGTTNLAFAKDSTTTISLLLPGYERELYGSIINVDSKSMTTAKINCKKDASFQDCSIGSNGAHLTQGPSTWIWSMSTSNKDLGKVVETGTAKFDQEKNKQTISFSYDSSSSGQHYTVTNATTLTGSGTANMPVTVTAGVNKLPKSTDATATGTHSTKSGAAVPAKTQNAVLAGVAVALGGVLAL